MQGGVFPWFAVQVRTRCESVVYASLFHKKYDVFLPTTKKTWRGYDRMRTKQNPLFPGYLFCRLNPSNRLPVLITPGVIRVVGSGGVPIPVDDGEIIALQTAVTSGRGIHPSPFLRLGESVRIEEGPLEGIEGILVSIKNSRRLVVSVCLLQRSVAVEIDSERIISVVSRKAADSCLAVAPIDKRVWSIPSQSVDAEGPRQVSAARAER